MALLALFKAFLGGRCKTRLSNQHPHPDQHYREDQNSATCHHQHQQACCKLLGKATGVARTCCKLLEKVQSVASRACCKLLEKLASRGCCKLLEQVKSVAPSDCMVSKCKRNDRYQPPPTPHPLLPRSIQRGSSLLRQQC